MKDVLPFVAGLLKGIADVEPAFPDTFSSLPCIILTETDNSVSVILSGSERFSVIALQIDIYDTDIQNVRSLAARADSLLAAHGIKRSSSVLMTDEDTPRMCMRYKFGLDTVSGRTVSL